MCSVHVTLSLLSRIQRWQTQSENEAKGRERPSMSGPATSLKGGSKKTKKPNKITRATGWGGSLPYVDNDLRKKKKDFFLFHLTYPVSCVCVTRRHRHHHVHSVLTAMKNGWKDQSRNVQSPVVTWKTKNDNFCPCFLGTRETHTSGIEGKGEGEEEEDSGTLSNKQTFQQKQHEVQQRAKQNKSYKRVRIEWKSIDFDGVPTAP